MVATRIKSYDTACTLETIPDAPCLQLVPEIGTYALFLYPKTLLLPLKPRGTGDFYSYVASNPAPLAEANALATRPKIRLHNYVRSKVETSSREFSSGGIIQGRKSEKTGALLIAEKFRVNLSPRSSGLNGTAASDKITRREGVFGACPVTAASKDGATNTNKGAAATRGGWGRLEPLTDSLFRLIAPFVSLPAQ